MPATTIAIRWLSPATDAVGAAMNVFRSVVFVAALAGLVAGLVLAVAQSLATVPLILQAETYEKAGEGHDHGNGAVDAHSHDVDAAPHSHEGWAPADGFERFAYTALANVVSGIGFALVLVAVSEFAGGIAGWRHGLCWGLAGFAVFILAPGMGLPPELPGMPAADLIARQIWWGATVSATGAGLWLIVLRRTVPLAVLGALLILAPHVIGAPQPVSHDGPVPAELHRQFVLAATLSSLVFWLVLGAAIGLLRRHLLRETESLRSFA